MQSARPSTDWMRSSNTALTRSNSSGCGAVSETIPTEQILRRVFSIGFLPPDWPARRSQVSPAVGEIEGLVDEREVGDDVAEDCVLERRPVLPGGIVRMAAADRAVRSRLERDEHGS